VSRVFFSSSLLNGYDELKTLSYAIPLICPIGADVRQPVMTFGKPDWFDQVGREVALAHEAAAIFDQSTFGKVEVEGKDAARFLNRICANNMEISPGRAIYTTMLNERGGIESDLTAIRITDDHYRLFVGTTAIRRDMAWLKRHLDDEQVTLRDSTKDYAVLGLMGPDAAEIAAKVGAGELNSLKYFEAGPAHIAGAHIRAVRMSYVGEAGWEITCKAENADKIYNALYEQGAQPAGVFAQSAMRIEKRFLAYGHDLDTDISPIQAGLDFAIAWDTDFIGRSALEKQRDTGETNRVVTIVLDDKNAVPLGGEPVYFDGCIAGKTTSATYGYRVEKPVAIANFSLAEARSDGVQVEVDIAGKLYTGQATHQPAYDPKGQRMRVSL